MQLEQINGLLLEKVNLQSEGIGHREKLLQRERDLGCVLDSFFFVIYWSYLPSQIDIAISAQLSQEKTSLRTLSNGFLQCTKRTSH